MTIKLYFKNKEKFISDFIDWVNTFEEKPKKFNLNDFRKLTHHVITGPLITSPLNENSKKFGRYSIMCMPPNSSVIANNILKYYTESTPYIKNPELYFYGKFAIHFEKIGKGRLTYKAIYNNCQTIGKFNLSLENIIDKWF